MLLPKSFTPIIQTQKTTLTRSPTSTSWLTPSSNGPCIRINAKASSLSHNHPQSQRAKAMPAIAAAPIMGTAVAIAKLLDFEALPLLLPVEEL